MNSQEIIALIKTYFHKFIGILKETFKSPYSKRYIGVAILFTIFFTIITFPYDVIIFKNIKKNFKNLYISESDFSLLGSSRIGYLNFKIKNTTDIDLNNIEFNPSIFGLLSDTLDTDLSIYKFNIKAQSGTYSGKLESEISDLKFNQNQIPQNGQIELNIKNLLIKDLTIKGVNVGGLGQMNLQPIAKTKISQLSIKADTINRILSIKSFNLKSNDLKAKLQGKVEFNNNSIQLSKLNLAIEIDIKSKILSDYYDMLKAIPLKKSGKILLYIKGTFQNPIFTDKK